jgi:SagB-type dehydrogenase family enzyme
MKGLAFPAMCFWVLSLCAVPSLSWSAADAVKLPKPNSTGKLSVEQAMLQKKSVREFSGKPLTLAEVSQMLWAANGNLPLDAVSSATTKVIPSAGGLYALEVFVVCGKDGVSGLTEGIYRYSPSDNTLQPRSEGDSRAVLASACLSQMWMARAPAIAIIGAVFGRMTAKYGDQGIRYVFMEAGNANQNLYLQAESLGLKMATVGAFDPGQVAGAAKLPSGVTPLLVMPVGK